MVLQQRAAMTDPNAPAASIEAILHAMLPFRFVDHSHANAIAALTCNKDGEARVKEVFGKRVLVVPYVMPGFILAKTIHEHDQGARPAEGGHRGPGAAEARAVHVRTMTRARATRRHIEMVTMAEEWLAQEERAASSRTDQAGGAGGPRSVSRRLRRAVSSTRGHAADRQARCIASGGRLRGRGKRRGLRHPRPADARSQHPHEACARGHRRRHRSRRAEVRRRLRGLFPAPCQGADDARSRAALRAVGGEGDRELR